LADTHKAYTNAARRFAAWCDSKVSISSPICSDGRHIHVDVTAMNAEQLQSPADRMDTLHQDGWSVCAQYLEFATDLAFSADSTWVCRPADLSPWNW
jgi:hypothetical protein